MGSEGLHWLCGQSPRPCHCSGWPSWMYAIFALARSLRPGHGAATAALPSPAGAAGHSQGGKEAGGSRAAPDVTGVADERRPPLRRPPRPCPSPRSCSRGRGRGRAGAGPGPARVPRASACGRRAARKSDLCTAQGDEPSSFMCLLAFAFFAPRLQGASPGCVLRV